MPEGTEVDIFSRIIEPDNPALPARVAQLILKWEFPESDRERMHHLLERAKSGKLTPREKREAESYERVGHFLSILKSKARVSLKSRSGAS